MRKIMVGVAVVLLLAGVTALSASARVPQASRPVEGAPGIQPTLVTANVSSTSPRFTRADVVQYVHSHRMWRNLAMDMPGTQVVSTVNFTTSGAVSVLLHGADMGLPDATPVCYVELQGTYSFAGPQGNVSTFHKGFEVFDSLTGNLILAGGLL
jgi:uncharacterized protein YceK